MLVDERFERTEDPIRLVNRAHHAWRGRWDGRHAAAGASRQRTVLATAAAAAACIRTSGVTHASIDLFDDPKRLTTPHRQAYERTLRETLPEIAREDPEAHAVQSAPTLIVRRVAQVPKRRGHIEAAQRRHGSSCVHRLCSQAADLVAGRHAPRIVVRNPTDALRSRTSKFTGNEPTEGSGVR